MMRSIGLGTALLVGSGLVGGGLAGCGTEEPSIEALVTQRIPVDLDVRGIAVDEAGRLFAIEPNALHERVGGAWVLRWEPETRVGLEDVAALEPGRFALTAPNMGYELDLATGALREHFCYEPGFGIRVEDPPPNPNPTFELARAVTLDRSSGLIYAQPQTRDIVTAAGTFSEIATFDRASGDELQFMPIDDAAFSAGGMAALEPGFFLAAAGDRLSTLWANGQRQDVADLSKAGITNAEGMAIDETTRELLVLDGPSRTIVAFDLDGVRSLLDPE